MGLSSLVPGVVARGAVTVWDQVLPLQSPTPDGVVDVFLRPENLRLVGSRDSGIGAVVHESTFLGSFRRTVVRTDDGYLVRLQHPASDHLEFGDAVRIAITPSPVTVRPRRIEGEDDIDA